MAGRPDLAVRGIVETPIEPSAPGADDELADAIGIVRPSPGILRPETLIVMTVAVQHHVRASVVQGLPKGSHGDDRLGEPGTEARVVPIGEHVRVRVCRQVRGQPGGLW